jgi:hypothetical protein
MRAMGGARFSVRIVQGCVSAAILASVAVFAAQFASAAVPSVTVTPAKGGPPSGPFADGSTLSIAVASNSYFTPNSRIIIIECADPGGTVANLPTDASTCDGGTVQGDTVLVDKNGAFSESSYTVFGLPSSALAEQKNHLPVCDASHSCVLFIGQDQNDFTQPKLFSAPFTVTASTSAAATSAPTSTPTTSPNAVTQSGSSTTMGTSPVATSLAQTGPPRDVLWLILMGTSLALIGVVGRRVTRVARS